MPTFFDALTSADYVDATTLNTRFQSLEDAVLNVLDGDNIATLYRANNIEIVPSAATATAAVTVGANRAGNGTSRLDLIGDATYSTYGLRVERGSGVNAQSGVYHRGTGALVVAAEDGGSIQLRTSGQLRATLSAGGELDVVGLVRAGGLRVDADAGGVAGTATITNATDTPTASLNWSSVGAPNAYLKIYVGTAAYVVPIWVT